MLIILTTDYVPNENITQDKKYWNNTSRKQHFTAYRTTD